MKTHRQFKAELMKRPGFKKVYDELELEFQLINAIVAQRIKKGITQTELAKKIGTKQSAVARFEAGRTNPTLSFLKKVTRGLGLKMTVK